MEAIQCPFPDRDWLFCRHTSECLRPHTLHKLPSGTAVEPLTRRNHKPLATDAERSIILRSDATVQTTLIGRVEVLRGRFRTESRRHRIPSTPRQDGAADMNSRIANACTGISERLMGRSAIFYQSTSTHSREAAFSL